MDINNLKQVGIYIVILGFLSFILQATLDAIFINPLPFEEGEVTYESLETGPDGEMTTYVTGFADRYVEEKYYYNESIKDRKAYLLALVGGIAFFLTWLVFFLIPKKSMKDSSELGIAVFLVSFLATFFVPFLFSFILPAPALWFPPFITDISDNIIQAELYKIYNDIQ